MGFVVFESKNFAPTGLEKLEYAGVKYLDILRIA